MHQFFLHDNHLFHYPYLENLSRNTTFLWSFWGKKGKPKALKETLFQAKHWWTLITLPFIGILLLRENPKDMWGIDFLGGCLKKLKTSIFYYKIQWNLNYSPTMELCCWPFGRPKLAKRKNPARCNFSCFNFYFLFFWLFIFQ